MIYESAFGTQIEAREKKGYGYFLICRFQSSRSPGVDNGGKTWAVRCQHFSWVRLFGQREGRVDNYLFCLYSCIRGGQTLPALPKAS